MIPQFIYTFIDQVGAFLSDDNIEEVKRTNGFKHMTVVVPFGELDFRERKSGALTKKTTIQNSWYNRPFNNKNQHTLADKARYAIQIICGIADMGVIPVSYIYDFPMLSITPRLYLKDRGHTTQMLFNLNFLELTAKQWRRVIELLKERPNILVNNIITTIENTLDRNKANPSDTKYPLSEMLSDEDRDRLKNLQVVVKVSIESMENHKNEMAYINNTQNKWTPHTFGMLALVERALDENSKLDVDTVYSYVTTCNVFLGEGFLFAGRKDTIAKLVSHEDEILWYWIGCRLKYAKDLKSRYSSFEDSENIAFRKEIYSLIASDRYITTDKMKRYADTIQDVGSNVTWAQLMAPIQNTCTRIEEIRGKSPAGLGNVYDLMISSPRAAIRWLDMVYDISTSVPDVNDSDVITRVVNTAIEMLELGPNDDIENNDVLVNLLSRKAGRGCREENFYTPLQTKLMKEFKNDQLSGRTVKKNKLNSLMSLLGNGGFTQSTFTVVDRVGENEYTYTTVNLNTGDGFQLGHKVSRKNGGRADAPNTFLQFPNDNIHNSSDNIEEGYWAVYKKWVVKIEKEQKNLPQDEKEHFALTKQFCDILGDNLI